MCFIKLSVFLGFQELAWLAQSAERETLNLKVAGSTPALGFFLFLHFFRVLEIIMNMKRKDHSLLLVLDF